ncbi:hypothetical protein JOE61_001300 [Nocardioides salarius]|uniref:DUF7715 domain-containing protein n=1 Tax=Nocardioides salarius TaxID=374513 RepID=A0ABS2M8J0_9ACTN|nr:hypothetical protein [Nocardioides salarius]MBM7507486.1 hypothetical protein [Nocardioides salarius]
MKVLVATSRTQGDVEGDYSFCVPGELLWITMVCDTDRLYPERGCGCGRGFGGLTSHRATTTAEVAELDITETQLRLAVTTSLTDQGWLVPETAELHHELVAETVDLIHEIAEPLPAGTIVRRWIDDFHAFQPPAPR